MGRFLMTLIVAMDANFRLKNLIRSSLAKDPGLHTGFAYFPPDEPYRQHVLKYASQKDVSLPLVATTYMIYIRQMPARRFNCSQGKI